MARKLPRLERVLDAPALFSIAYGEIASSIYFALGIIAFYALGLTPLILFGVGLLFLLVSFSYAEGTAAVRETGGAATLVRVAYNDLVGFVTGSRVRATGRDARVHRPRDGRELRGGGPAPRPRPAAQPVRGNRSRRRPLRRDRGRRPLGIPAGAWNGARIDLAPVAAARHRR